MAAGKSRQTWEVNVLNIQGKVLRRNEIKIEAKDLEK
jgi:hypothetical protein